MLMYSRLPCSVGVQLFPPACNVLPLSPAGIRFVGGSFIVGRFPLQDHQRTPRPGRHFACDDLLADVAQFAVRTLPSVLCLGCFWCASCLRGRRHSLCRARASTVVHVRLPPCVRMRALGRSVFLRMRRHPHCCGVCPRPHALRWPVLTEGVRWRYRDLSRNGLNGSVPPSISALSRLIALYVRRPAFHGAEMHV
jgi:hypothetical protein